MKDLHHLAKTLPAPLVTTCADVPDEGFAFWVDNRMLLRREGDTMVGLSPFLYTWGLLRGVTDSGYSERWCYSSFDLALVWAFSLSAELEPEGYVKRHPALAPYTDEDGHLL